jgi:hypothetical protein
VCNPEQREDDTNTTVKDMNFEYVKPVVIAAWILGAGIVGLVANVRSLPAAVILAVVALGPPLVMVLLWKRPQQTLAESVQEARR